MVVDRSSKIVLPCAKVRRHLQEIDFSSKQCDRRNCSKLFQFPGIKLGWQHMQKLHVLHDGILKSVEPHTGHNSLEILRVVNPRLAVCIHVKQVAGCV